MRHALVVAYYYPPESSSSGVLRTLEYTRYLGRFGWRVTVLTLNRDAYQVSGLIRPVRRPVRRPIDGGGVSRIGCRSPGRLARPGRRPLMS